eukprot:TRINITY_DN36142_c0_g1_i1.p1 TRINITY_DN36142_c0_g1~~TRINITY_DN36142_c0_g1_i1.p1  ORF type:complete len:461 (-),score=76.63 TRINITY_DN36142_c0_g1_i1:39-1421(-)
MQRKQPSVLPEATRSRWQELPEEVEEVEEGLEVCDDSGEEEAQLALDDPEEMIVAGRLQKAAKILLFGSSKSLNRLTRSLSEAEDIGEELCASTGLLPSPRQDVLTENSTKSVTSQLAEGKEESHLSFGSLPRQDKEELWKEPLVSSASLTSHRVETVREEPRSSNGCLEDLQADELRDDPSSSLDSFPSNSEMEVVQELHSPSGFFTSQGKKQARDERRISFDSLPSKQNQMDSPNPKLSPESLECSPRSVRPEGTKWDLGFSGQSIDTSPSDPNDPATLRFFRKCDAEGSSDFRDRPVAVKRQPLIMEQTTNPEASPRRAVGLPKRVPPPPHGIRPLGSPRKRQAYARKHTSLHRVTSFEAYRQHLNSSSVFSRVVPSVPAMQASSGGLYAGELNYDLDELKSQGQVILASLRAREAQLLKASGHPARDNYKAPPKSSGWHHLRVALSATSRLRSGVS